MVVQVPEHSLHFFAIGDWGRQGQHNQRAVAMSMGRLARQLEPEFFLSLGDHFYPNGIASVADENVRKSFEDIYTDHELYEDWFPVLGNHEYRGNPQAAVDLAQKNRRWRAMGRYYAVEKVIEDDDSTRVLFLFLDTTPFVRDYYLEPTKYALAGTDTVAQRQWMDSVLTSSTAEWKFIIGHHHVYSGGKRTTLPELEALIVPRMQKHGVQAYLNGHEHDLQHIVRGGKHFLVSGAGSRIRPAGRTEGTRYAEAVPGFMALALSRDALLVQVIDEKGRLRYRTQIQR